MYEHIFHIYVCTVYIERSMFVHMHFQVVAVALVESRPQMWGFDFAWVAAPEAPVRSPSSDATRDLAGRFCKGCRCGLGGVETPDVGFRFRLGSSARSACAESLVGCAERFSTGVSASVRKWTKHRLGPCGVLHQRWCGFLRGELVDVFDVNVRWRGAWVDTCPKGCGCSPWRHVISQSMEGGR
jgi:hypothetical protein